MPVQKTSVFPAATPPWARGRSGAAQRLEKGFSEPQRCQGTVSPWVSRSRPPPSLPPKRFTAGDQHFHCKLIFPLPSK